MSSSRLFVSSFLIGLGAVLLLGRLDVSLGQWFLLSRLWPVLLILTGIWVMDRKRKLGNIPSILLGLVVAVFFGAFLQRAFAGEWKSASNAGEAEEFTRPFGDSTSRGAFRLEAGAGTFTIGGATDDLIVASVHSNAGHYVLRSERIEQSEDISLVQQGSRPMWLFSRSANRVSAMLNPAIPWDLHIDVGASRMDLDLTQYIVERVVVECGVSQIQMRLGERSEDTRCSVKAGASSIRILIPRASACEIDVNAPLSRKSFTGFEKTNSGSYRTENYFSAGHKIFITLDAGVSSLMVIRY